MSLLLRNGLAFRQLSRGVRIISTHNKSFSQQKSQEVDPEQPIKFMGSKAQKWKTIEGRTGTSNPEAMPWFQPFIVVGSVAIFLIYFCILREENDIDRKLESSLFDKVPGLEEQTLQALYKYNLEHNIDNTDVIRRLMELGVNPLDIK